MHGTPKYGKFVNFPERVLMLNKCVKRKESCVCEMKYLLFDDIYQWKLNLMKNLYLKRMNFISKLSPQQRINICLLYLYGISTQYWSLISRSSAAAIVNKMGHYDVQFFLKDISTKMWYYAPKLIKDRVEIDEMSGKVLIRPESVFLEDLQLPFVIDISEFNLYECILAEKNVDEIISVNCQEEERIIKLLELLESVHLIYYIRILN